MNYLNIKMLNILGVEFGARMIPIENKQVKLQIWDTVRHLFTACF